MAAAFTFIKATCSTNFVPFGVNNAEGQDIAAGYDESGGIVIASGFHGHTISWATFDDPRAMKWFAERLLELAEAVPPVASGRGDSA